jgi:hypothetical protein
VLVFVLIVRGWKYLRFRRKPSERFDPADGDR